MEDEDVIIERGEFQLCQRCEECQTIYPYLRSCCPQCGARVYDSETIVARKVTERDRARLYAIKPTYWEVREDQCPSNTKQSETN